MKSNDCTWHEIYNKSDDDVATQIKKDGIDVLIDLSGHTDGNRLGVFRHKPAPIQMTWLGHVATTGLSEIDYIIADRFVLPEGDERFYTESALRLPNAHLCFSPPGETPAPQHASAGSDSFITFGCFSNIKKLNERVISTWSRILERVPESKLLIKNASLSNDAIAQSVRQQFSDSGTPRDQVIVLGKTNYNDHINTFGHVDIALDTFPYGGMTTTLETLWMGVPVIALAGQSWAGRVSASILTLMGTPELNHQIRGGIHCESGNICPGSRRACGNSKEYKSATRIFTLVRHQPIYKILRVSVPKCVASPLPSLAQGGYSSVYKIADAVQWRGSMPLVTMAYLMKMNFNSR